MPTSRYRHRVSDILRIWRHASLSSARPPRRKPKSMRSCSSIPNSLQPDTWMTCPIVSMRIASITPKGYGKPVSPPDPIWIGSRAVLRSAPDRDGSEAAFHIAPPGLPPANPRRRHMIAAPAPAPFNGLRRAGSAVTVSSAQSPERRGPACRRRDRADRSAPRP